MNEAYNYVIWTAKPIQLLKPHKALRFCFLQYMFSAYVSGTILTRLQEVLSYLNL